MPLEDVATPVVFPLIETATNNPNSGTQQISFHELAVIVLVVQLIPSGDVITVPLV